MLLNTALSNYTANRTFVLTTACEQVYFFADFFPTLFCIGCVSVKEVNKYAAISVEPPGRTNEIHNNFTAYRNRNLKLRQMPNDIIDTVHHCTCNPLASKADCTCDQINRNVTAYLQGAKRLNNNQNLHYNFSGLADALEQYAFLKPSEQLSSNIGKLAMPKWSPQQHSTGKTY